MFLLEHFDQLRCGVDTHLLLELEHILLAMYGSLAVALGLLRRAPVIADWGVILRRNYLGLALHLAMLPGMVEESAFLACPRHVLALEVESDDAHVQHLFFR